MTDNLVEDFLFTASEVPGSIGMSLLHFPATSRHPAAMYKPAIHTLLKLVDEAQAITETDYSAFWAAMRVQDVPPAIIHRIVALCFPTQLANTVTDNAMDSVYSRLVQDGVVDEIPVLKPEIRWFSRNLAVSRRIREILPNTDDAWRSCLVWTLH